MQLFTQLTYKNFLFSAFYYISTPQHLQVYLVTTLPILNTERVLVRTPSALTALGFNKPDQPPLQFPDTPAPVGSRALFKPSPGLVAFAWTELVLVSASAIASLELDPWAGLTLDWVSFVMILTWLGFVACGAALPRCCR